MSFDLELRLEDAKRKKELTSNVLCFRRVRFPVDQREGQLS